MFRVIAVITLALSVLVGSSVAGVRKDIQFKRGETSVAVDGVIGDSDRDRYYIVAKQGQTLNVRITSANSNGIFHVYSPGYQEDGDLVLGRSMEGARETTSARVALVASGTHLIDVGTSGGGTRYRLVVAMETNSSTARESLPAQTITPPPRGVERDSKSKVEDWLAAFIKKYGTDHETRVAAPTMAFRLRYERSQQVESRCQMAGAISNQFETSSSRSNISTNAQVQSMIAETYLVALYGACPKAFSDIVN
jgi:hypothetical protein